MTQFRSNPPRPLVLPFLASGAAQPPHIDFEGTEVCHSARRSVLCRGSRVVYDHHHANVDPGEAYLASLPAGSFCFGHVEHGPVVLAPEDGVAQKITFRGKVFAIPREDGSFWHDAPLPEGICPVLHLSEAAEDQIRELLPHCSLGAIARRTPASRKTIEIFADCLREAEGDAMRAKDARPIHLHFRTLKVSQEGGPEQALLHVVASEPALGLHWTLAVIDLAVGGDLVAAIVAELIVDLPHPESLQALITEGADPARCMVAEALEMAQVGCPHIRPLLVIDRFHIQIAFRSAMAAFRRKCHKQRLYDDFGRRMARLSDSLREERRAIRAATILLERLRPDQVAAQPGALRRLEEAFAAAPELEVAYDLLEGLRVVFDSRSPAEADARYAAWQGALEASGLRCFDEPARQLAQEWPAVRAGFEAAAFSDRSFHRTSTASISAANCLAREIKALRSRWRYCSLERLQQRVLAHQGYIARTRRDPDDL